MAIAPSTTDLPLEALELAIWTAATDTSTPHGLVHHMPATVARLVRLVPPARDPTGPSA